MLSNRDLDKAKGLYMALSEHLKGLRKEELYYQTKNACDAVRYLEEAESAKEKEYIVKKYFNMLFPSRGGLSDIVIWDSDFKTRVSLNEPLNRIEKDLWDIIRSSYAE